MKPRIPLLDLSAETNAIWDELRTAIEGVVRSGEFILGPEVAAFEHEVAEYIGVKYAVGVNSGTDALVLALRALGVGPGDEVVTTPFSFVATAEAVSLNGAQPVFADIDPTSFCVDPEQVMSRISARTKAILPVHLYGHAAEMGPIMDLARRHGLAVLEDVAQAFGGQYDGRRLGSIGHAAAFSFFPSKNLGAFGDAGLVATNDPAIADKVRILRAHGSRRKYYSEVLGYNSRLDSLQAAVLRVKLRHVSAQVAGRQRAAARYSERLTGLPEVDLPVAPAHTTHAYHQYTIRIRGGRRDQVQSALRDAGIATMVYYPVPIHRLPFYSRPGARLPHADTAAAEVLSLPLWPEIELGVQEQVVSTLRGAISAHGRPS